MANTATPFYKLPLLSLDTETTGVNVFEDRIVTCNITYAYLDRDPVICDWLINPGVPIPEGASKVHGITDEIAQKHGRPPQEALWQIAEHLEYWESYGLPVVIYNAPFDITILKSEFERYDVECSAKFPLVIDPLVIDKEVDPWRKGSRRLEDTAKYYGIELDNAHAADADSMASVLVARVLGEKFEINDSPEEVHNAQVFMKMKQAQGYQKYLRTKKGEVDAVINGQWPYMTKDVPF